MLWKAFIGGVVGAVTSGMLSHLIRAEIASGIGIWIGLVVTSVTLLPPPLATISIALSALALTGMTYQRVRQDAVGFAVMISVFAIAVVTMLWARRKFARTP